MKVNLLEALTQVPDFRAARGRRYPLWLLLLLVIMGTLSDCLGYRARLRFLSEASWGIGDNSAITSDSFSFWLNFSAGDDGNRFCRFSQNFQ